jgi:hypothetical protein
MCCAAPRIRPPATLWTRLREQTFSTQRQRARDGPLVEVKVSTQLHLASNHDPLIDRMWALPRSFVHRNHHITVISAVTGEVLRDFTLDPTTDYQPTGAPKGPKRKKALNPQRGFRAMRMSCNIT